MGVDATAYDYRYLAECLDYFPESGDLRWKTRPSCHFSKGSAAKCWNRVRAGSLAGTLSKVRGSSDLGYFKFQITIDGRKHHLLAHRVCWILYYKKNPEGYIDHINGIGQDNRIENLRDVSAALNRRNSRMSSLNRSGISGVWYDKRRGEYKSEVSRVFLGWFPNLFDAACARKSAELKYSYTARHGERLYED